MGIYVQGMKMPKKGEYHMTLYVCGDGAAYVDVAELPADEDRFAAAPVPPHGRLIDADALIIDLMDRGIDGLQTDDLHEIQQSVMDCPTIIPAEE